MKNSAIKLFAVILTILLSSPVSSALINVDDQGDYFIDRNDGGLMWLDVTQSVGRSYSDVYWNLRSGGEFEGWRFATAAEFGAMVDNVTGYGLGITGIRQTGSTDEEDNIDLLIHMLGETTKAEYEIRDRSLCDLRRDSPYSDIPEGGFCNMFVTQGMLADYVYIDQQRGYYNYVGKIGHYEWDSMLDYTTYTPSDEVIRYDYDRVETGIWTNRTSVNYKTGSFLVADRIDVPEPSSIALLALGLAGLGVSRRKKAIL